ncbi:MAG: phage portal protein [Clostridiales bacterium]|nr:phage portal protein [Clostridiales bacterium]
MKNLQDLTGVTSNWNMAQIIRILKEKEYNVNSEIIKGLIASTRDRRKKQKEAYEAYKASKLPIDSKEAGRDDDINNKIKNDFRGDIVDTFQGYLFGEPVSYMLKGEKNNEEYQASQETLDELARRCGFPDLDSETGKMAGICGFGARLLYVDTNSRVNMVNVRPWETVFVKDQSLEGHQFALRLYIIQVQHENNTDVFEKRWKVEWYDRDKVTYYVQNKEGDFVLDDTEPVNPSPHLLGGIPLIKFQNNSEEQSDFERVETLIDAYDRVVSYNQDEAEAFRNAYLITKGGSISDKEAKKIKNTGHMEVPENAEVEYLTKNIKDQANENLLDRLETNIYKFSKCPNYLDKEFQNASGVALLYRLLPLENKSISKERKFVKALRNQFDIIRDYLQASGRELDTSLLDFQFTRNIPVDLGSEAEATGKLKGMVSEETRLSLLSFVESPKDEMERMEKDMDNKIDLDALEGGNTGNDTGGETEE